MSSLPVCQTLLLELHNGVLHITLNRPECRNAMSLQMVAELRSVLAAVRDDRGVRALVIGGAGKRPSRRPLNRVSPSMARACSRGTTP